MLENIKKSVLAAFFIALGVAATLTAPAPLGTFLFAFGLMSVCFLQANLYTGKCGYIFETKQYKQLITILLVNIISGWFFGFLLSLMYPETIALALEKIASWETNYFIHFLRAIFCGAIMFTAVDIKKSNNSNLGIIYGIPLFIFAGFQHSIANAIMCGVGNSLSIAVLIAAAGNLVGAVFIWWLKGRV